MTERRWKRRWSLIALVGAVLFLVGLHTAAWLLACNGLAGAAAEAIRQARAEGWAVSSGPPHRAGWPIAAEWVFPDLIASGGPENFPPGLVWHADTLALRIAVTAPTTLVLEPGGRQTIAAAGLPTVALAAGEFAVTVPLTTATPPAATVRSLTASVTGNTATVRDALLTFPPDGLVAELNGIALPAVTPEIRTLRAHAALTRPVPPGATPAGRLRAWRDAGGSLDMSTITLQWGRLDAAGRGAIALDAQLQPKADGEVEATGIALALDDLARGGTIPTSAATAAKAVIAILAAPAPGAPVRLPVTLRSGVLAVAGFPLLRTAPLKWE